MNNLDEAKTIAKSCLSCKNAMCKKGCPIATNIPEFISEIKNGNIEDAYQILQENNVMSNICSTICPSENQCMSKCIRGIKGNPIKINSLERFVNEWAEQNSFKYPIPIKDKNNINVAIIGSGPAGLSCAYELLKEGFNVTIFEKESKPGGLLEYGIPDFRLPREKIKKVIKDLKDIGLKIELNREFGKDFTIEDLKKQKFNYIFLAMGAAVSNTYKLTDEKCSTVYKAGEFLKVYNTGGTIKNLGDVIVIGGGNVAFDSARAAIRMGAKTVTIAYRRNEELMPARKDELEDAIKEGIKMLYLSRVISAEVEDGKLTKVNCIKTEIRDNKVLDIEGSEFKLKVDTIVFAIGLSPDKKMLESNGITVEGNLVKTDENYQTNIENIFAGGDLVETKSTVCRAIATGKKVAKEIIKNR